MLRATRRGSLGLCARRGVPPGVELFPLLLKLGLLLGAAKLGGELAERLRQPAVMGELLAGALVGPSLLGRAGIAALDFSPASPEADALRAIATLGAVLLLFEVGLGTSLREMRRVGGSALLVALVGIAASFGAGFAASSLLARAGVWPDTLLLHVLVGATFTATSVGITARVLRDLDKLASAEARVILGAAVLDDVGGLLVLGAVAALAAGAVSAGALAIEGALALAFLLVALVVGRAVGPRLLAAAARFRARGALLAIGLAVALALAAGAELVHLAAIVGAFVAGLALSGAPETPALVERVSRVSDALVPLFFAYVGAQVDLRGAGAHGGAIAIAVVVLLTAAILGKLVCGLAVAQRGVSRLAVGVGMVPRGEVGLIFALFGVATLVDGKPLLDGWMYAAILIVVALTTLLTPPALRWALQKSG